MSRWAVTDRWAVTHKVANARPVTGELERLECPAGHREVVPAGHRPGACFQCDPERWRTAGAWP